MRQSNFYWSIVVLCVCGVAVETGAFAGEITPVSATISRSKPEPGEVREFEVRVDHKPVGTHLLTIKSVGDTQQVSFQTDVKIDVIVYAYTFKLEGKEVWREGRVETASVRCEDGGKKRSFTLKTDGCHQEIAFNGKPISCPSQCLMTTAYWRLPPQDVRDSTLTIVDVDNGRAQAATLEYVGTENITCAGRSLNCRHFKIDGPSPAELWFDEQERLVCQKSIEQGHHMELRLKQIRVSKE